MSQVIEIDATYVASKLKDWAAKSGQDVQKLKGDFERILKTVEGKTDQARYRKTLRILKSTFETNMNSTAITYRVILLGQSSANDAVKRRRQEIMDKFEKTPSEVIASGEAVQNPDGSLTLIDIRKQLGGKDNPFYMKAIPEHSFLSNCVAVAMKPGEDQKWLPANIVLRGDFALHPVPLGKEMDVRLNGTFSSEQGRYNLSSAKPTSFDAIVKELSNTEIVNIIDTVFQNKFVLAKDLESYHQQNKNDMQRFVVTEGIVNGYYIGDKITTLTLGDDSLDIGETITCFVDPMFEETLKKLDDKDIVSVIGRTTMTKEYDFKTKQKTDKLVVAMNLFGIFVRPE